MDCVRCAAVTATIGQHIWVCPCTGVSTLSGQRIAATTTMDLNASLRSPTPNKEFRRVSSQSIPKGRVTSPKVGSPARFDISSPVENNAGTKSPLGSGAGRFSPSQYLGRSLSRTAASARPESNEISSPQSSVQRLNKPLLLSQDEMREARRERHVQEFNNHRNENSVDYIGLRTQPGLKGTPLPQPPTAPSHSVGLAAEETGEFSSPSPPPPPPSASLLTDVVTLDKMRRDATAGAADSSGSAANRGSPAFGGVSQAEEEVRARRYRRIQALQADYRSSIDAQGQGGGVSPVKALFPTNSSTSTSTTIAAAREKIAAEVDQWVALHGAAADVLDEQILELSDEKTAHMALQQQLVASEAALAVEGERNAELLFQLQQVVSAAEKRAGPGAVRSALQHYPAAWLAHQPSTPQSRSGTPTTRSRANSGDFSASQLRSPARSVASPGRSRSNSRGDQASVSGVGSRSTTPTASQRRYEMYGASAQDGAHDCPSGRAKVDPKVMPASESFAAPWSFRVDPDIKEGLAAVGVTGHRFYGPPAQARRYDCDTEPGMGNTVITAGSTSRSNSAQRSRTGTITSYGGNHTAGSDYLSYAPSSDLSTLGGASRTSVNNVRSNSASRLRVAHTEKVAQQGMSPKSGFSKLRATSPAGTITCASCLVYVLLFTKHVVCFCVRTATPQSPSGVDRPSLTPTSAMPSARAKMDTLFSASGELYEMTDEGALRADEGANVGTTQQVQSSQRPMSGALEAAKAEDYRAGYSSPEVVRPRLSISHQARDSPSGTNNRGAQLSQQSVQQSPQGARDVKKLARSLSNSALSPRLRDGAVTKSAL
jgi:hypothetical protein